jgi:hypothetical protein
MNLEHVENKIRDFVNISVGFSVQEFAWNTMTKPAWYSIWCPAYSSVENSMWDSVNIGLQKPVREERKQR